MKTLYFSICLCLVSICKNILINESLGNIIISKTVTKKWYVFSVTVSTSDIFNLSEQTFKKCINNPSHYFFFRKKFILKLFEKSPIGNTDSTLKTVIYRKIEI